MVHVVQRDHAVHVVQVGDHVVPEVHEVLVDHVASMDDYAEHHREHQDVEPVVHDVEAVHADLVVEYANHRVDQAVVDHAGQMMVDHAEVVHVVVDRAAVAQWEGTAADPVAPADVDMGYAAMVMVLDSATVVPLDSELVEVALDCLPVKARPFFS